MTDQIPRVIDADDARKNDLLELSGYKTDPDLRVTGRARHVVDDSLSVGIYSVPGAPKVTLLDRPAPPKPPLPTTPGTVIRIGGNVWLLDDMGDWYEAINGTEPRPEAATDWTVVYDPSTPKADDGLRERVEALAALWEATAEDAPEAYFQQGYARASVLHAKALRNALTDSSAS